MNDSYYKFADTANAYKTEKYTPKTDLEAKGLIVSVLPFEVGSRGHISKENKMRLTLYL